MHSIIQWNLAKSPNYSTNVDKIYPYSEVPYIGNYKLVKLPFNNDLLEHVDYWGEGRICVKAGASGFTDCYNVNHHYQLVSNGPDTDRKIPNRIPVISYSNCDTSSYIKDDSVKVVTLMGAPINKSCASDIVRMVNKTEGKVIVYGFDSGSAGIKNLEEKLTRNGILLCPGYNLMGKLNDLTLFNCQRVYLNKEELAELLYKHITEGKYDISVAMSKSISESNTDCIIIDDVVKRLLNERNKNLMAYAYRIWNGEAQNVVVEKFPKHFKLIVGSADYAKIIDKQHMLALELDANETHQKDRLACGYGKNKSSTKLRWNFIPIWENNQIYFKIKNADYDLFLNLDIIQDEYKDRKALGAKDSDELRFQWSLEPFKLDDDVLFFIVNREYGQGLKLDAHDDQYGNRQLWGNHGCIYDNPEYYGWYITSWE